MDTKIRIATLATVLFIISAAAFPRPAAGAGREGLLGPGAKNVQAKNLAAGPTAAGRRLRLDLVQAQLTITPWEKNEVAAEATVEVGDSDPAVLKEFLDKTMLTLKAEEGGLVLRLTSPLYTDRGSTSPSERNGGAGQVLRRGLSYAARVAVRVPASQALDVSDVFGDVSVTGITGLLKVRNESGRVLVEGGGGELAIENSFAEIRVADFAGPVDIRSESAAVRVERIGGRAAIRASFKEVRFAKIGGPLTVTGESAAVAGSDVAGDCRITSSFQKIDVRGVRGRFEFKGESASVAIRDIDLDAVIGTSFGDVSVTGVGGSLEVGAESAGIAAADIKKDALIRTTFGNVEARRVGGLLSVDAESSGVLAEDVGGAVDVRTSFGDVILRRTSGSITVTAENAPVEISEIKALPAGSVVNVKTSFRPIRITLPAGIELQGTASAGMGKVVTDIPVTLAGQSGLGGQVVSFGAPRAGVKVKLETTGDITIVRK